MIRSGDTNAGGHRRGKHVSGVFGMAQNPNHFGAVNDAYTRSNDQPVQRGRTTRAWAEAIKWTEGKTLKKIIAVGIARGNWE